MMYFNPHQTVSLRRARHQRVTPGPKLAQQDGRRCAAEGCDTRLSRYNPADTCNRHEGWRDKRMRRHD